MRKRGLFAFLMALLAASCNPKPQISSENPGTLTIAAASSLKFALDDLLELFRAENQNINVRVTYGSSGNFRTQIEQGAPFDLFLSADRVFPEMLIESGRGEKGSLFDYAVGRMVIWVRDVSPLDPEQSLVDSRVRKIAIANPKHSPYGQAAVAAFKSLGVYEQIKDRFVMGENIAQAAQFVETGAADIGVIALALATAPTMAERGRYWEIPLGHFPTMFQSGVILTNAQNPDAARALLGMMITDSGQELLRAHGFLMPQETQETP